MAEPGPVLPELLVWRALAAELGQGHPGVLVVVVAHTGSSPGRTGWLMAVGRDGWLAGTTGGGVAEADAVRAAVALLAGSPPSPVRLTQTHRPDAQHPSGLLCGGEQVLTLVPLDARAIDAIHALDAALTRGETFTWTIWATGWAPGVTTYGGASPDDQPYTQTSGPTHRVVLVGAGHVGAELACVLVTLGFRITVVDERAGASSRLAGIAHDVVQCPYEQIIHVVPPGDRTYVVVATHSPDRDAAVVAALTGIRLGYLGVLGSRAKLAHLPDLATIDAPMGVPIGSHTPEEIAVSVAARLIAQRSGSISG